MGGDQNFRTDFENSIIRPVFHREKIKGEKGEKGKIQLVKPGAQLSILPYQVCSYSKKRHERNQLALDPIRKSK